MDILMTLTDELMLIHVILDNYVHRLVASKTDGKMVQYECEGDTCQAEKIDSLQLEVSFSPLYFFAKSTPTCSDECSVYTVLAPADESTGVSEDLLGE